ncbi:PilZ domain-containing protein [Patescibacteria group bacterium]|nr:PilZ domain-containing protein [Patescibacteria group bacterium]
MRINGKRKFLFSLILIFFISGFIFINSSHSQEEAKELLIVPQKTSEGIRIAISTSGSVKFNSYWLDDPTRLVIKFKTRNVLSAMEREVVVAQGPIKRITSSYFTGRQTKALKTLTFELSEKVSYKIWQEENNLILDIQTPLNIAEFAAGGKEIFATDEANGKVVERLEAMDVVLSQAASVQLPLEFLEPEVANNEEGEADEAQVKEARPEIKTPLVVEPSKVEKSVGGVIVWLASLGLISGLGFLSWRRWKLNIENKLKAELSEEKKRVEIEESLRKVIEQASQQKEKECEQLKGSLESLRSELQEKGKLLTEQESDYKSMKDEELAKKDRVYEELKETFRSLKEKLVKKELKEKELSPEEEKVPWEVKELAEGGKRRSPRLPLTRDFNKTIILRVKSPNLPQNIKAFAKNVSLGGLSFETKEEFKENDPIDLRLFFYGGQVSSTKIQTHIVWKRKTELINEYGVSFDLLEEKESLELKRYIETKKEELVPAEVQL